ncbi:MAG: CpsD/CapB family tyrosine-protein kinase [Ruminococcaceae bacterium]|nr:CpsD/CapB family tyrosine-protein kinase [Oscillospiraceae bacterium]
MKQTRPYGYGASGGSALYAAKEAYRTIRTNLLFSLAKTGCKTIMFTSSISGEGKTTTAANVAFSIARGNKKVLLMDLDLRNPHVHRILKKSNTPGLTNYLSGFAALEEIVHKEVYPGLDVICSGTISPNPAEMVASRGMIELLDKLKEQYEFIILDTPPITLVSDALSVVPATDGVVLVIRPKYTDRKEVRRTIDQIEFVGGKILGAVANGVQQQRKNYGSRYGRYGYGRYGYGYGAADTQTEAKADTKEEKPE